jgi:hypothetical protein
MRKPAKILSLASALAALAAPAAAPPIADAAGSDKAEASPDEDEIHAEAETKIQVGTELMSFTVHRISDSLMFPQHSSHSSHASHASHASSSPGFGLPDAPNLPYVPYAPYVPNPVYAPPVAAPPVVPPPAATTAPPGSASDPAYLACTRASNGFGVNDIASELERVFGMAENEAVNIAQQALTAVLAGGHYCDAYLGDHE